MRIAQGALGVFKKIEKMTTFLTVECNMSKQQRAYEVCIEMLLQRGCIITDKDQEQKRITALKPDGESLCVLFNATPKVDTKSMKEIITFMNECGVRHSIVIHTEGVTPATRSTLSQTDEMYIELFNQEDLQYNITKHRLQPSFDRLTSDEAVSLKKKYGTRFGTLGHEKPIARFFDYTRGDVIRVLRQDGYINYRIVR